MHELGTPEVQHIALGCLDDVVAVCRHLDIPYFLDHGTLLGAARHGGFIPWDDDVDICIPQPGFDRFLVEASAVLPANLRLAAPELGRHHAKVLIGGTSVIEDSPLLDTDAPNGQLWIDIFPMVGLRGAAGLRKVAAFGSYVASIHSTSGTQWLRVKAAEPAKSRALRALSYVPSDVVQRAPAWAFEKQVPASEAKYVGHPFGMGKRFGPEYFPAAEVFPLGTIEFEGRTFSAPRDVDAYLRHSYGNWRELPPPESRRCHILWAAVED